MRVYAHGYEVIGWVGGHDFRRVVLNVVWVDVPRVHLQGARRIVAEWPELDEEQRRFTEEVELGLIGVNVDKYGEGAKQEEGRKVEASVEDVSGIEEKEMREVVAASLEGGEEREEREQREEVEEEEEDRMMSKAEL